uniref:Myosin IXAa n=1 Tax=Cyprinus carpio TaxID=7962 RepID=A0A8C1RDY7_CYPCA
MSVHDVGGRRRFEDSEFTLRIYPGVIAEGTIYCPITARKVTSAAEVIEQVIDRLQLDRTKCYVLAEVKEFGGEEWILNPIDSPIQRMMLWPRMALENRFSSEDYRFLLREKNLDGSIHYGNLQMWLQVTEERRRMVERGFLPQPLPKDFDDLCNLPDLNEKTLLDNLRSRFKQEKIYTYVGSILIVINPFKFLPIYNPKYVKMYDNHQLGKLEPHIYAVADVAYHAMLQSKQNQCIVISGESGSGKTQSTNFLIHHLTALSQKGFASGVEQIILGAGPVLEAFGNAKTAHNNNSSRFGKFIQVNYQESGTVRGAYVEKYLLEKSRLVYQEHNERNYHVFYYLLAGSSENERTVFHLKKPEEYHYLNQMTKKPHRLHWENYYENEPDCFTVEGEDLKHDFERLQLAMEMVGFHPTTRKQIFSLLSAILHLGNIRYKKKIYRDDSIDICNPEVLPVVSELLEVKEEMLFEALTTRKTVTVGEKLIVPYKLAEVSKQKNYFSVLNFLPISSSFQILSIGVLDIFGFEDYENNSFEQFCINFANERLQHYFNQHIFKLEQEEYRSEGIAWHNIDYIDNTGCINLISKKPTALLHLLDEECNFPQATNQTLLDKFKRQHEGNSYIEFPAVMEPAFIIKHYAGKVKYGVKDFREKNTDHMRPDIVALLKSSKNAFICGLIGIDPVATFRWAVLRAYFRAMVAFRDAGKRHVEKRSGHDAAAPVVKSVDSFSFLHHPVHQRSLEILQRCKEEKYSKAAFPLSRLLTPCTLAKNNQHVFFNGWNGRAGRQNRLSSAGSLGEEEGIFVNSTSSKLLERAHGILMRNKNYKMKPSLPKHLLDVKSLKYLSNLTLQDRITKSLLHLHKKKKPPSISAQFQASLNKLMETLGQSEPYFVKCIRSNAEKLPLRFNDALVLRQLRYTGMLETVRIRQSGYSIKYTFQDFVRHFHVLLPEGTNQASREAIRRYLHQVDLTPEGFQVGHTMVFLREAERLRLQDLLHQEVLRRIINLQRRFRALLERRNFLRMRQASCQIQNWWRSYQSSQRDSRLAYVQQEAAVCIQSAWRGFKDRRRLLLWREAAVVIQRNWRLYWRGQAACRIQTAWRGHRARKLYLRQRDSAIRLQAAGRGYLARQRYDVTLSNEEQRLKTTQLLNGKTRLLPEEDKLRDMGLDHSIWEDSCEVQDRSRQTLIGAVDAPVGDVSEEMEPEMTEGTATVQPIPEVSIRERPQTLEDPNQRTRAKRESRRMRELEQAKFSLELLKVRSTGGVSPSEERRWSMELVSEISHTPQGSPDSQSSKGSFELLNIDDYFKDKAPCAEPEDLGSPSVPDKHDVFSNIPESTLPSDTSAPDILSKPAESSFLILKSTMTSATPCSDGPSKTMKDKKEPTRRPMVVVISMQKESLLNEEDVKPREAVKDSSAQTSEPPSPAQPSSESLFVLERLEKLNEDKEERQKHQQQQNEKEMMDKIRQQKHILKEQREIFSQHEREVFEKQRVEALQKIEKSRQEGSGGKPDGFFTDRGPAPIAQPEPDLSFQPLVPEKEAEELSWRWKVLVFSPTVSCELVVNSYLKFKIKNNSFDCHFNLHLIILILFQNTLLSPREMDITEAPNCFSKNIYFIISTLELVIMALLDSSLLVFKLLLSLSTCIVCRVRGKMRFWGKARHAEKKTSRERLLCGSDGELSEKLPDLTLQREFKENKDPSPKVKRRRSVKISSVALEPVQWQNDALQILTCANDYRSMNDFLMKKITDLDTEDGKNDTMVDVVFKKALKEFRLNIFNSYSTALAMDDGKSIRYKDLYALFEQILEKNMRQEQRDWSESPVKVWVNTFKVFLDEFMTEHKPLDSSMSRAPKPDRKKRRKKDTDIVAEHNGHIFKSTQYSIPTYCEYCSSLIWMMDKACVCKLCRYACHRKCCQKMTTKCCKKYDPELSSRQFGVELSRLTNDERAVPLVVEKLINYIEMHGLYSEGIYRKSGSTNKIKELKQGLDTDVNGMNLDDYNINVIASVFKQWLRDLPNPLMTFELYEEFLRAMGLQDKKEVIRGVYSIIDQLSRTHLNTLERLIFHLVRIALQEETNRMSANALAIVFAPCILRCPDTTDPMRSVQDIGKTTACVELIICEQMNKYKARLKDISTLEFAENKAKSRLTFIRRSMKPVIIAVRFMSITRSAAAGKGQVHRLRYHTPSPPVSPRSPTAPEVMQESGDEEVSRDPEVSEQQQVAMQQEEKVLTEQIESLQKEKEELTFEMLSLEPRVSDDETLESEASIGTADSSENLNVDSEGRGPALAALRPKKSEGKSRRVLRKQPESLDSMDSSSAVSSVSSSYMQPPVRTHKSHLRSKSPSTQLCQSSPPDSLEQPEHDGEERPQFTSRSTFNPEKGKQRLQRSPQKHRDPPMDGGPKRDPDLPPKQVVVYGSNEFMV